MICGESKEGEDKLKNEEELYPNKNVFKIFYLDTMN